MRRAGFKRGYGGQSLDRTVLVEIRKRVAARRGTKRYGQPLRDINTGFAYDCTPHIHKASRRARWMVSCDSKGGRRPLGRWRKSTRSSSSIYYRYMHNSLWTSCQPNISKIIMPHMSTNMYPTTTESRMERFAAYTGKKRIVLKSASISRLLAINLASATCRASSAKASFLIYWERGKSRADLKI